MKILMLNWRDLKNPRSGGAEVLTEGILKELVTMGHEVTLFSAAYPGSLAEEYVDGYRVIRRGSGYSVHVWAFIYWLKRFRRENFDVVIDQIHGVPFLTPLYVPHTKRFAFIHEVAKDIWFKMFPFPFSYIGYAAEYLLLQFYRHTRFITVSDGTKADLISVGIPEKNISITAEAINMPEKFDGYDKNQNPTVIFLGRLAPMKRVGELLEACAIVKKSIPNLETWIVGPGEASYVESLKSQSERLGVNAKFWGRPPTEEKFELLAKAHILGSASVKEGYGLVIIEAGVMGTPSVVYDVAGFREAVIDGKTGLLSKVNTPNGLAESILKLFANKELYAELAESAKVRSRNFTFENAAKEFEKIIA